MKSILLSGIMALLIFASPVLADTDTFNIFFNQYTLIMAFLFMISFGVAKAVGGNQVWIVFGSVLSILVLFLSVAGLFPSWIIIISLIASGGIFAYMVMKVISG